MRFYNFMKSASFACALSIVFSQNCITQKMVINVPVTDLRTKPQDGPDHFSYPLFYRNNPMQDTQLLLNEHVLVLEKHGSWLKVQSLEQRKFYASQGWTFQTGYIKAEHAIAVDEFEESNIVVKKQWTNIHTDTSVDSDTLFTVSIGTKLLATEHQDDWFIIKLPDGNSGDSLAKPKGRRHGAIAASDVYQMEITVQEELDEMRRKIISTSKSFGGTPYSWGGRSAFDTNISDMQTGVDCSSFVNLVFRANGLQIPRDAHDQFMMCKQLSHGGKLQPGDLIFFATPEKPNKMHHVLIYAGHMNGSNTSVMIESTGYKENYENQIAYDMKMFGQRLSRIKNGQVCSSDLIDKQVVYFGTYLGSHEQMQTLRLKELNTSRKKNPPKLVDLAASRTRRARCVASRV